MVLVGSLGGNSSFLAQFAAFSGAALQLGESTSIAAGQAINLTGVVAASATDVVSAVTSNGLTAAANAWRGVDILDLQAQRCTALLTLDGGEVLQEWFDKPASVVMVPCLNPVLRHQLLATAESVSLGMPAAQFMDEVIKLDTSFESIKVWGQLLPSGKLQLTFELIHLSYHLAWSNPLWDQFQLDVQMERSQILRSLRRTLIELPQPTMPVHPPSMELQVEVSWPLLKARMRTLFRRLLLDLSNRCWFWAVETFRGGGAVNECFLFVTILVPPILLTFWLGVRFWLAHYSTSEEVGQCFSESFMALEDGSVNLPADDVKVSDEHTSEDAELSAISEHTESDGKKSSAGSFQLVSAIPVSSEGDSSPSSLMSEVLPVGPSGS